MSETELARVIGRLDQAAARYRSTTRSLSGRARGPSAARQPPRELERCDQWLCFTPFDRYFVCL